jgi:hypothetical protein
MVLGFNSRRRIDIGIASPVIAIPRKLDDDGSELDRLNTVFSDRITVFKNYYLDLLLPTCFNRAVYDRRCSRKNGLINPRARRRSSLTQ